MVRIVDVGTALEYFPRLPEQSIPFMMRVEAPLPAENAHVCRIDVQRGGATIQRGSPAPLDLNVGISMLSQLYVGVHSVDTAKRAGDIVSRGGVLREPLKKMFLPQHVALRAYF